MSRIEHHGAFGILFYYIIYIIWSGSLILPSYYFNAILYFSILPDFDAIYYIIKGKGRLKSFDEFLNGVVVVGQRLVLYHVSDLWRELDQFGIGDEFIHLIGVCRQYEYILIPRENERWAAYGL